MLTGSPKSNKANTPTDAQERPLSERKNPLLFRPLARAGKRTLVELYEMMKQCETETALRTTFKHEEEFQKAFRMFEVYRGTNPLFAKLHIAWNESAGTRDAKQIEEEKRAFAIAHAETPFVSETELKSFLSASERNKIHSPKTGSLGSMHSLGSFTDLKGLLAAQDLEDAEVETATALAATNFVEERVPTPMPTPPI